MKIYTLSTPALYKLIEEAEQQEGDEAEALVDEAFDELDRREIAIIEEWYAPAS